MDDGDDDELCFEERRSREEACKPLPDELKLLKLHRDAKDVALNVEQLEELARRYVDQLHRLDFLYEAYGQISGREQYFAGIRLGEIGRIIGADRVESVTSDITRQWLATWKNDVAVARERYNELLSLKASDPD